MTVSLQFDELPVRLRFERALDDDELLRFCSQNDDLRIERETDGDLIVMTPAGGGTGRKNAYLVHMLASWAERDGQGYYFDSNTGFTLPDGSMRSPDAAWIEAGRWNALSARDQERFSPIAPDFVIELRSPTDGLPSLQQKVELWLANGVRLAWLIDPIAQAVTVYEASKLPVQLLRPEMIAGTGPVDGFELPLSNIWM